MVLFSTAPWKRTTVLRGTAWLSTTLVLPCLVCYSFLCTLQWTNTPLHICLYYLVNCFALLCCYYGQPPSWQNHQLLQNFSCMHHHHYHDNHRHHYDDNYHHFYDANNIVIGFVIGWFTVSLILLWKWVFKEQCIDWNGRIVWRWFRVPEMWVAITGGPANCWTPLVFFPKPDFVISHGGCDCALSITHW